MKANKNLCCRVGDDSLAHDIANWVAGSGQGPGQARTLLSPPGWGAARPPGRRSARPQPQQAPMPHQPGRRRCCLVDGLRRPGTSARLTARPLLAPSRRIRGQVSAQDKCAIRQGLIHSQARVRLDALHPRQLPSARQRSRKYQLKA